MMSEEGTTQGDPLSMAFYALATTPMIRQLGKDHPAVRQIWYADDSGGAGQLVQLRAWLETVIFLGRMYGYNVNVGKTVLLVKPGLVERARQIFESMDVKIVSEGTKYLGSAIGEPEFLQSFFQGKVAEWLPELERLKEFASTEPQAAFAALTHGLRGRWNYVLRTLPAVPKELCWMDAFMVQQLLPVLTGHCSFSDDELKLLHLPARLGGIGFPCVKDIASQEFEASRKVTAPQVKEILRQGRRPRDDPVPTCSAIYSDPVAMKGAIALERRKAFNETHQALLTKSSLDGRHLELLSAKGVSAWLTVLPLKDHGFQLNKREFWDALALRYNWHLDSVPVSCVCGKPFSADHAMVCSFGGFPTIRHNELRDITAELLTEVCHNVAVEPVLLPLSGEVFSARSTITPASARADVRATGFWTTGEDAYFDVKVFHPYASSYQSRTPASLFQTHETRKCLEYEERIVNVDHGSFTPLVFSSTGSAGPMADTFLQRLAGKLSEKDGVSYSSTIAWLRCRFSFILLRGSILCIHGSRSCKRCLTHHSERELAIVESRLDLH